MSNDFDFRPDAGRKWVPKSFVFNKTISFPFPSRIENGKCQPEPWLPGVATGVRPVPR